MARKSRHAEIELFDYLNGRLDSTAAQIVEQHLAVCPDCASIANLVRTLKSAASNVDVEGPTGAASLLSRGPQDHPDVGELARFFYSKSSQSSNPKTAAHVAACRSCASEIGEHARAESAASQYQSSNRGAGEVPASAWKLIREWEESVFAMPKDAAAVLTPDLLEKLRKLLDETDAPIFRLGQGIEESVPVMVVDRQGALKRVETFERVPGEQGSILFRHSQQSEMYDNKPVHVLLDAGESGHLVVSRIVERGTLRLEQTVERGQIRRADFFIIED